MDGWFLFFYSLRTHTQKTFDKSHNSCNLRILVQEMLEISQTCWKVVRFAESFFTMHKYRLLVRPSRKSEWNYQYFIQIVICQLRLWALFTWYTDGASCTILSTLYSGSSCWPSRGGRCISLFLVITSKPIPSGVKLDYSSRILEPIPLPVITSESRFYVVSSA